MRVWTFLCLAFVLSATGLVSCGPGVCGDLGTCSSVDEDGGPSDYIVELAPGLVGVSTPTVSMPGTLSLTGGEVVIHSDKGSADCFAFPSSGCRATLKRLTLRFDVFDLGLSNGQTVTVEDATLSMVAPVAVVHDGFGYEVPQGTSFQTCASIDGRPSGATAVSTSSTGTLIIAIDGYTQVSDQILAVAGSFPMLLHADDGACTELPLTVSGDADGVTPFKQVPPLK
jgi:hypothetical protein